MEEFSIMVCLDLGTDWWSYCCGCYSAHYHDENYLDRDDDDDSLEHHCYYYWGFWVDLRDDEDKFGKVDISIYLLIRIEETNTCRPHE